MNDQELAELLNRHVRAVKAGVTTSCESLRIDDLWVIVSVERSIAQRPEGNLQRPRHNQGAPMSTYWGYRCLDDNAYTGRVLNHGESQLRELWDVVGCIDNVSHAAEDMIEIKLLGADNDPFEWLTKHLAHNVVLENEYGDRETMDGKDAREYGPCDCPPGTVSGYVPLEDGDAIAYRLKNKLGELAKDQHIIPDWERWHYWQPQPSKPYYYGHVPPERRSAPHHHALEKDGY